MSPVPFFCVDTHHCDVSSYISSLLFSAKCCLYFIAALLSESRPLTHFCLDVTFMMVTPPLLSFLIP